VLLLQVERLASGTLHEPSLVVAALDVTSAAGAPAFTTRVLGVTHLPAALLYPEGAPGCLLYTGGPGLHSGGGTGQQGWSSGTMQQQLFEALARVYCVLL
jgi:hypothetical protein